VLVTGATGCIGRAVVDAAAARGWRVRACARNRPADWRGPAEFERADVLDTARVSELADGCDVIVHLAGSAHRYDMTDHLLQSFIEGARAVAHAARSVNARLMLVSSASVYGRSVVEVDEESLPKPDTAYGRVKLESEQIATSLHGSTIILRPAVVYGRYDRGNVARLIRAVARFGPIVVGTGDNQKSLLFAPHFAERIVLLMESSASKGLWCVADNEAPSQTRLVRAIAGVIGRRRSVIRIPLRIAYPAAQTFDLLSGSNRWAYAIDRLTSSTVVRGQKLDEFLEYHQTVTLERALAHAADWVLGAGGQAARI
jgi:nucleoside-diphosphate-sugar epimerase